METAAKPAPLPVATVSKPIPTPGLLLAMLGVSSKVSDLILSPGSFPMVELSGKLTPVKISGMPPLTPEDTRRISYELIEGNKQATESLQHQGIVRHLLSRTWALPFSRKHFSTARQSRHRDASDSPNHPYAG